MLASPKAEEAKETKKHKEEEEEEEEEAERANDGLAPPRRLPAAPEQLPTNASTSSTTTSTSHVDAPGSTPPTKQDDDDDTIPPSTATNDHENEQRNRSWEDRILLVRRYYEGQGYRVHSGLQFGCELVLYADDPSKVHSDFCVHVVPEDGLLDWRMMQSLVRSMPDLHKTLILANPIVLEPVTTDETTSGSAARALPQLVRVDELAFATEHAPFRHRKARGQVGSQRKSKKAKRNEQEQKQQHTAAAENP